MENLKLFIVAALIVNAIPGVDRILVLTISLRAGSRSGMMASLGIAVATIVHAFLISIILFAILNSDPILYKWVEQGGLGFLGIAGSYLIFRSLTKSEPLSLSGSNSNSFWAGFIIHFMNPLAIIFTVSFIPQFIEQGSTFIISYMLLSLFSNGVGLTMNLITAVFFGMLNNLLVRNLYPIRIVDFLAGSFLLILALLKISGTN